MNLININLSKFKPLRKYLLGILGIFLFWLGFVNYTNFQEVAIRRNIITGNTQIDSIPGFNVTAPWVQVARLDTRPHRVCIECKCRNINCELVSFDPKGWKELIEKEGFRYYWWSNRFSFNSGHKNEYRGLIDVLKGYSFDGDYTFIDKQKEI